MLLLPIASAMLREAVLPKERAAVVDREGHYIHLLGCVGF
jgi:hypothetical protein